MSEVTPEGLATKIVAEIPNFFRDGINQLLTGEGEYIRAGEPRGQVGKIGQAVARSYCRQYGANPGAAKFGNAERIENACRPYLDDLGQGSGPVLSSPFQGGQCNGELYFFTIGWTVSNTGAQQTTTRTAFGPIGAPSISLIGGQNRLQFTARGSRPASSCSQVPSVLGPPETFTAISGAGDRSAPFLSGLVKCSGVDGCGNIPPVITPPVPGPDPVGPRFRFNPGPNIDLDIGVDVNPDGTIDIDVGTGPINVDLFPSEGGDGGGGGGDGDGPPGDVGEEDSEGAEDADENGPASGCAGENQVLGGLKITITTAPASARLYAPGVHRGACYIYMGVEDKLDQDFGGSMLRDGQFFLPEKKNLTCWEVHANLGYRLRVTPYYITMEEDG